MSVLGRGKLIELLRAKEISGTPLLSPKQIGTSSIDLPAGNVTLLTRARGSSHVNPALAKSELSQRPYVSEMRRQLKHDCFELPFRTELLPHPRALALVPTFEWISVPSTQIAEVTARSTWAQEGLSIATATLIEPGCEGIVTSNSPTLARS